MGKKIKLDLIAAMDELVDEVGEVTARDNGAGCWTLENKLGDCDMVTKKRGRILAELINSWPEISKILRKAAKR